MPFDSLIKLLACHRAPRSNMRLQRTRSRALLGRSPRNAYSLGGRFDADEEIGG
jgi:hypothetical protein